MEDFAAIQVTAFEIIDGGARVPCGRGCQRTP
jgi:hypothetical protein